MSVVRDLERLVSFPTISNRPVDALSGFLAERFERLGFRIERFDDPEQAGKHNLVCTAGPEDGDGLVLSGHMDVVPTEGQPWTSDPFAVTERDGALYGRGTADMKGFFACTLAALERLDLERLTAPLVMVWTYDEEVGCLGSGKLVRALEGTGRRLPSQALIGEPTDFRMLRAHPGHVAMRIDVRGAAAHSSRPDLGINAIEAAAEVVREVRRIAVELQSEPASGSLLERPWVAVNVATITGGTAVNIVPDRCSVQVGYRQLPGMVDEAVFERITDAVTSLGPDRLRGARVHTHIERVTPAMLTPDGRPLQALLQPHASHPECGAATFATDGGNLAKLGMECLVFGPGRIEVAHQADEHVPIEHLHRAVDVIADVVAKRCLGPSPGR